MNIRFSVIIVIATLLSGCGKNDQPYQGYVEGENIYLSSPNSGALVKLSVKRGQHVKQGELLFMLDPNPQAILLNGTKAALLQAARVLKDLKMPRRPAEIAAIQAQLAQADAKIGLAAIRVKRNQILFDKHVMDKDTLDASIERYQELQQVKAQYQANLDLAHQGARPEQILAQRAQVKLILTKLEQAQWELSQKTMYAPAEGVIFDTYFRRNEFVAAQRPVLSLLTPYNTRIEFFVPLNGLAKLYVGKKIKFSCENCTDTKQAVISYISPEAEYVPPLVYSRDNSNKLVYRIKAMVPDPKEIMPGQPVMVFVSESSHE